MPASSHSGGALFLCPASGRVLLPLRSSRVADPGVWHIWGGWGEEGELPAMTALREAWEESAWDGQFSSIIPLHVIREPAWSYHVFLVQVEREFTPLLNWETEAFIWADVGQLPTPLHPQLAETLIALHQKGIA